MAGRHYTPTEVNRVIPELEAIIKYLRSLEGEIQEKEWHLKQSKLDARRHGDATEDFLKEEAEIDFLRILAQGQFERVRDLGGELKGGYLVDFPGRIDDQDVLLCWKPGEASVRWYHGPYEGMMGRKPIPDDLLGGEDSSASGTEGQ